jgi:hypothetical protein
MKSSQFVLNSLIKSLAVSSPFPFFSSSLDEFSSRSSKAEKAFIFLLDAACACPPPYKRTNASD